MTIAIFCWVFLLKKFIRTSNLHNHMQYINIRRKDDFSMPVFFICFIVFVIFIRVKMKEGNKKNATWDQEFWEKEREANFVRKKDISELDYIRVKREDLPFSDTATGDEKYYQDKVQELLTKKMLNLSGQSNTEIKLAYGTANFPILAEYDQNYTLFIRALSQWGSYLQKNVPDAQERAKKVLEYAVSLGSDITATYLSLANIYLEQNQLEKIQDLINLVESSDFYMKDSIIQQLKNVIRNYE